MGFDVVLWNAFAVGVHQPEVVLRLGVALFTGQVVSSDGFDEILWDAVTFGVHQPEGVLRIGIVLRGVFAVPGDGFGVMLLDAATIGVHHPALDRSTIDTDRADNTALTILDPVAITDEHLFRWGDPPNTYSVKSVDGVLQDEDTGVRFASEVTLIR